MGEKQQGPLCRMLNLSCEIDEGTLARTKSKSPVPSGSGTEIHEAILGDTILDIFDAMPGIVKSMLLSILDFVMDGSDRTNSVALLKHYLNGKGKLYEFEEVPIDWQEWIIKKTRGQLGLHENLNPYNSGIYDLRNSLGHFDVRITRNKDQITYVINDTYHFGFREKDKYQQGRHGFGLGKLSMARIEWIKQLLPTKEYYNPGGFKERFEIKKIGNDLILFIPQQFLVENGDQFPIKGSFIRSESKKSQ